MIPLLRPVPSLLAALLLALTACSTPKPVYQAERFAADNGYSRRFSATPAATCEAARRALLSQGYQINDARADGVDAKKTFQPDRDQHVEIGVRVTCAPETSGSIAFANAEQTLYGVKKTSSAASVGVGAVGSISLPLGSSDDSLVKIGAETIPAGEYYDRFFDLVKHYLPEVARAMAASETKATPATPPSVPQAQPLPAASEPAAAAPSAPPSTATPATTMPAGAAAPAATPAPSPTPAPSAGSAVQ